VADISIADALAQSRMLEGLSDTAALDVQLLLADVLERNTSYLYTWPEKLLTQQQVLVFDELLQRRISGEPIAYLLGYQDFWSLRLKVSKDTLIPRPDTELLVEQALSLLADGDYRVADLGTGTGAIALSLAAERPSWQVIASDFLPAAAALAKANRDHLKLTNVEVVTGSWLEPLVGKFDLIVSNPPYIDANDEHLARGDVRFEPLTALVATQSGLKDLRDIIEGARDYLVASGWLLLEHGFEQGEDVRRLFESSGYQAARTLQDFGKNDRVTLAQWVL